MEMPSSFGGTLASATSAAVGRKSQNAHGWSFTVPGLIFPGQRTIKRHANAAFI